MVQVAECTMQEQVRPLGRLLLGQDGRPIGVVESPRGPPRFGAGEQTVYLRRDPSRFRA
jgi:hypothetical protein